MFTTVPDLGISETPDYWFLAEPLVWVSPGLRVQIPKGFKTDLASIPAVIRNLLDVNGRSRCPAILHDWLYSSGILTREDADEHLRLALSEYGESPVTARVYWLGVRAGGWKAWNDHRAKCITASDFASPKDYYTYAWSEPVWSTAP